MLILDVADERFDRGAASHFAFDGGRHAAFLACRVDFERMGEWRIVAAISGVSEKAVDVIADHGFHLWDHRGERVPVIGIAWQCLGMERKQATL